MEFVRKWFAWLKAAHAQKTKKTAQKIVLMNKNKDDSFQDQGAVENCYGCGAGNASGLQIKSFWTADGATCEFKPKEYHSGGTPEIVYGGLIASLIDCHSCNLAIATLYKNDKREIGSTPKIHCVTADLNVSYKKPVPIDATITVNAKITSLEGRKIWVESEVIANNIVCAEGKVLAIKLKD